MEFEKLKKIIVDVLNVDTKYIVLFESKPLFTT